MIKLLMMALVVFICSSCAVWDNTQEFGKTVWGSSTRVLEQKRDNAITRTYDKPYWDCVRNSINVVNKMHWVIFKKDEIKGYMIVMGIKGNVNTTEIGIFFDELSDNQTRIQVTSLSTNAKRKVSRSLFHGLDVAFGYLPPNPPKTLDPSQNKQTPTYPLPE